MTQKLVLQINSLEALERLIGGDSKLEFDIRQSVVESFTKKHLKTIANESYVKKATEAITAEIKGFNEKITKLLNDAAENIANDLSPAMLEKRLNYLVEKRIKEKLGLN